MSYRIVCKRSAGSAREVQIAEILGTILNKVPINKNGSYGKYYYGKYSSEYLWGIK
jgi:hypothetical protein